MAKQTVVQGVFDPKVGKVVKPWTTSHAGATAYSRAEAQRFAQQLIESQDYREWLKEEIKNHTLEPSLQQMLWAYAYGKPTEHINLAVSAVEDLSNLTIEELQQRAQQLQEELEEAKALEAALPTVAKAVP